MLCQNCGDHDANVRYTQIINGVKKEMFLCEKCSQELGIGNMDFSMPINLSSFLGEFLEQEASLLPSFATPRQLKCDTCNMSYDEFIQTGRFGCEDCFDVFSDRIDSILRNIQGGNRHLGRIGKVSNTSKDKEIEKRQDVNSKENSKIEQLKQNMKEAIAEERYEDAAKIRDEIKKIEKEQ